MAGTIAGDGRGGLHRKAGRPFIEGVAIAELVREHGTPLVAYSAAELRANARACVDTFGPLGRVLFSYKACYLAPALRLLHDSGVDAEVCSGREYALARSVGLTPDRIAWNAVALSDEDAERVVAEGVAHLGLNTLDDVARVARVARSSGASVDVVLRIHPRSISSTYLDRGSRLGLDVEDGRAAAAVEAVLASPGLNLRGFHSHTQVKQVDPGQHVAVLRAMLSFADEVAAATGLRASVIGIGGGLARSSDIVEAGGALSAFGVAFARVMADDAPAGTQLLVEPGRYLVSGAATGISRLLSRTASAGKDWWIIDLGTQFLVPFDREFDVSLASPGDGEPSAVSVGDRLSSYTGVLKRDALLSPGTPDDIVLVHDAGAYTTSTAQRFMYGLPGIVMVDGRDVEVAWHRADDSAWAADVVAAGAALQHHEGRRFET